MKNKPLPFISLCLWLPGGPPGQVGCGRRHPAGGAQRDGHHVLVAAAGQAGQQRQGDPVLHGNCSQPHPSPKQEFVLFCFPFFIPEIFLFHFLSGSGFPLQLPQLRQPATLCQETGSSPWRRRPEGEAPSLRPRERESGVARIESAWICLFVFLYSFHHFCYILFLVFRVYFQF